MGVMKPLEWLNYPTGRAHDPTDNAGGGEMGIDLSTPLNTPITTPFAGTVTYAGGNSSTGGIVKIASNIPGLGAAFDYFLHLNTVNVKAGQQVSAGQVLGLSGGQQAGAGGWPHVEYGVFTDPKYASQYWGFQSGSTLDPTNLVNYLQQTGQGIFPDIWQGIQGGMAGTAGLPSQGSAPTAQDLLNIQIGQELGKINYSLPGWLWQGGLILLGGLLFLAGAIIFILPSRKDVETGVGTVVGAAVKAP